MKALEQKDLEKKLHTETVVVYQGRIVNLQLEILSSGKKFEIVKHGGAVVILPILPDGKLLLVQQWRRAVNEITIELPAGTLEKEEEPLVCAQRELREETGYRAKNITSLGGFYSAPGFCDEYLHLFVAEDLEHDPLPSDDGEMIDLLTVSKEEAKNLIETNQIHDAKTIVGILRYFAK